MRLQKPRFSNSAIRIVARPPGVSPASTLACLAQFRRVSGFIPTGTDLLTDKQRVRLEALFGSDEHVEVEATWTVYQRLIAAYRDPDRSRGMSSCAH